MRVSGLATGMDTESIIKDMMQASRLPLNKVTQKKQQLEWQLDDYRSINRDLKKFDDHLFSTMILSDSFRKKTVAVSAPDAVSIKNVSSTSDFSGSLQIHQLAKNATLQSSSTDRVLIEGLDSSQKLTSLNLTGVQTLKIKAMNKSGVMEEKSVQIDTSTETLQSALDKINKETDVHAFYDEHTGQIAMTSKNGGAGGIEIEGGDLKTALKFEGIHSIPGQNADFTFNGLRTQRSSNTFQINGFEVTLKAVNETGITFSSAPDTDKILETVVKFVDDYNKLIGDLNAQIREPKYRDFQPLSAEQKADMKEKEIELWEEKAMSGMLRNDPIISNMLSKMRTALMGSVGEGGPRLSDIGITTSKDYLEHGKLVIDEKTLREAINADPNKVHELFSKNGATESEQGFAQKLRGIVGIAGVQKQISKRAGSSANAVNDSFTLGRNLNDMDKQIERFEARLKMTENRLWKQFTAMEVAINRANAQSANLMGAFGGM